MDSRKRAVISIACFGAILAVISIYPLHTLFLLACLSGVMYISGDQLVAHLVCEAIARAPVAYKWTIDKVCIRPSIYGIHSEWSCVSIHKWTWHNPLGFENCTSKFILEVDELTLYLNLTSIIDALLFRSAIIVDLVLLQGVRFKTTRNSKGALNLWEALNLPDSDANVRGIIKNAKKHGGLQDDVAQDSPPVSFERQESPAPVEMTVSPLPPVATDATRTATHYWRPEWGNQDEYLASQHKSLASKSSGLSGLMHFFAGKRRQPSPPNSENTAPLLATEVRACETMPSGQSTSLENLLTRPPTTSHGCSDWSEKDAAPTYVEYPIGDPRRRPRWGVPLRFDIRKAIFKDVHLWILDLLTMDAHRSRLKNFNSEDKTGLEVAVLKISRKRFEKGDPRRAGAQDGVRGVYLGELIWVIVAEVIPIAFYTHPSQVVKNAVMAAGYAVKDIGIRLGARAFQAVAQTSNSVTSFVSETFVTPGGLQRDGCRLKVHLLAGRQVTRKKGKRVNVHTLIELRSQPSPMSKERFGTVQLQVKSSVQMWTRAPQWDQHFNLGPVRSKSWVLRVACYHQRLKAITKIKPTPPVFLGEVMLPISQLMIQAETIQAGNIVGWFPLLDEYGEPALAPLAESGQLKLGLRLEDLPPGGLPLEDPLAAPVLLSLEDFLEQGIPSAAGGKTPRLEVVHGSSPEMLSASDSDTSSDDGSTVPSSYERRCVKGFSPRR